VASIGMGSGGDDGVEIWQWRRQRGRKQEAGEMVGGSGRGGEGISGVGHGENFLGMRGSHFLAEFNRADLRSSNRASHLGRAESLFSVEVGSTQVRGPV
jgi:hypothetical protein